LLKEAPPLISKIIPSDFAVRLQRDLPTYIAAANGFSIDHGNVSDFTKEVMSW
jgi:hypothetical protein